MPLDVRVTDKDGKPVTDLRQDECTVVDDGTKQDIRLKVDASMGTAEDG